MNENDPPAGTRRVRVFSAAERRYCEPLLAVFHARHPDIEVDFQFGISVALHERFLAERGVDVLWSSAMDLQIGLALEEGATSIPVSALGALPSSSILRGTQGGTAAPAIAVATTREPLVTLIRRDLVDPSVPLGSLGEITAAIDRDPERFRGRVALFDIETNGLGCLAMLTASRREPEHAAFMRAMETLRPQIFGSNPPLVAALTSGRAVLGLHVLGSYARRTAAEHPAIGIARTTASLLAISRIAIIPRDAPDPAAAGAFIACLLSDAGQRALGEGGLFPIRAEGSDTRTWPPGAAFVPIGIDADAAAIIDPARRSRLLAAWRAARLNWET